MTLSIQIAKFKFRQHQVRTVSPNLMLSKVTCFTVVDRRWAKNLHGYNILTVSLEPLYHVSCYAAAISWYEGIAVQEVIVQGVRQGINARGSLERKHR